MGRKAALAVVGERVRLPSMPGVVQELNRLFADPDVDMHAVGDVIAQDPTMTARVLRIANSAYYGLLEPVLSADQAAAVLGAESLRNVVMQASVVGQYENLGAELGFDMNETWTHAVFVGQLAQNLTEQCSKLVEVTPEEMYTCGLLHDIGKVVLLDGLREEYVEVFEDARRSGESLHMAEERELGYTHIDVGSLVAERWGLPEAVCHAIRFHHGPRAEILQNPATAVVALADQVAYRVHADDFEASMNRLGALAEQVLDLEAQPFRRFIEFAKEARSRIEI